MSVVRVLATVGLMAILWGGLAAAETLGLALKSEGPVVISGATRLTVHSTIVGRDFVVDVTLPHTPPVLPGQTAPVLYVLDGGYDLAGPAGWLLGGAGMMAPAYIVTVGYPDGEGEREVDLLFGPGTRPDGTVATGGGGAAFLDFLTLELKPFIEARYPVDPERSALFGHSLSGIFTANVLARRPTAFSSYLIASPSVWADPGIVERLSALKITGSPLRVFVAYGAQEEPYMIDGARQISAALERATGLIRETRAFEGQQHISYYPALTTVAFPFLLPRDKAMRRPDPIVIPPERLGRYVGIYRLSDGRSITISRDEDGLVFKVEGRDEVGLLAEAVDRFYIHGVDASIVFDAGVSASAGMSVSVNGATARAERAT